MRAYNNHYAHLSAVDHGPDFVQLADYLPKMVRMM
jgi:hypothetical protein